MSQIRSFSRSSEGSYLNITPWNVFSCSIPFLVYMTQENDIFSHNKSAYATLLDIRQNCSPDLLVA